MSKDPMSKIRATDVWKAIQRVLDEFRIDKRDYDVEDRRPHPLIRIRYAGVEREIHFSGTPSSRRAPADTAAKFRRTLREMQMAGLGGVPTAAETDHVRSEPGPVVVPRETKVVAFRSQEIPTFDVDGVPYAALKPIVEAMGLEWSAQTRRVQRDPVLAAVVAMTATTGSDGKRYQMLSIPLDYLNGFLFGIDASRVRADLRDTVIAYQTECYRALAAYWGDKGGALVPHDWDRALGMLKMLAHKVTVTEKAIEQLLAREDRRNLVPAYDLAGTVTALDIIEMSGVPAEQRVRGTSSLVTRHMKVYCLNHGYRAEQTPRSIDADERWRFPREAAADWLVGSCQGVEIIRGQVAKQRARRPGSQLALVLPFQGPTP
jgi:hypothetical protein